jgi:hypothetical protein
MASPSLLHRIWHEIWPCRYKKLILYAILAFSDALTEWQNLQKSIRQGIPAIFGRFGDMASIRPGRSLGKNTETHSSLSASFIWLAWLVCQKNTQPMNFGGLI